MDPLKFILSRLRAPDEPTLQEFHRRCHDLPFSYTPQGTVLSGGLAGFDFDRNEVFLGRGEETFERARRAIHEWRMFPRRWTAVYPAHRSIAAGNTVAVVFRVFRLWWMNACRIVALVEETEPFQRSGFIYGTLLWHLERGEELFMVERRDDDSVWYVIQAVSRPNYWYVRLGYFAARYYQRRFVRESKRSMQEAASSGD